MQFSKTLHFTMQIIVLDTTNHAEAAKQHFNAHVNKLAIEATQLLSMVLHILEPETAKHVESLGLAYRFLPAYRNHPLVVWTQESKNNYKWICDYGIALCNEYYFRYGKHHKQGPKTHACDRMLRFLATVVPYDLPNIPVTEFCQLMPSEYRTSDPVAAFRAYYQAPKNAHIRVWAHRSPPHWFKDPIPIKKPRVVNDKKRKRSGNDDSGGKQPKST